MQNFAHLFLVHTCIKRQSVIWYFLQDSIVILHIQKLSTVLSNAYYKLVTVLLVTSEWLKLYKQSLQSLFFVFIANLLLIHHKFSLKLKSSRWSGIIWYIREVLVAWIQQSTALVAWDGGDNQNQTKTTAFPQKLNQNWQKQKKSETITMQMVYKLRKKSYSCDINSTQK